MTLALCVLGYLVIAVLATRRITWWFMQPPNPTHSLSDAFWAAFAVSMIWPLGIPLCLVLYADERISERAKTRDPNWEKLLVSEPRRARKRRQAAS